MFICFQRAAVNNMVIIKEAVTSTLQEIVTFLTQTHIFSIKQKEKYIFNGMIDVGS